jgi:hypothetical protein
MLVVSNLNGKMTARTGSKRVTSTIGPRDRGGDPDETERAAVERVAAARPLKKAMQRPRRRPWLRCASQGAAMTIRLTGVRPSSPRRRRGREPLRRSSRASCEALPREDQAHLAPPGRRRTIRIGASNATRLPRVCRRLLVTYAVFGQSDNDRMILPCPCAPSASTGKLLPASVESCFRQGFRLRA